MTNQKFNEEVDKQLEICKNYLCKKGEEYNSTIDRLEFFKQAASLERITPEKALAGFMAKHTLSIYNLIDDKCDNLALFEEKITDHINYLLLLKCLLKDEYEANKEEIKHDTL